MSGLDELDAILSGANKVFRMFGEASEVLDVLVDDDLPPPGAPPTGQGDKDDR